MNKQVKKKLRIILIIFIISMIPLGVFLKMSYGIYLNDRALKKYYGAHLGKTEIEAAQESIKDFESAKKYYRTNYLIYYNQAKIYAQINQYDKAIETIEDLIEIDSKKIKAHAIAGMLNELNGNNEEAKKYYIKYRILRIEKYPIEKLNDQELKGLRIEEAMDYFFLQDTLSFRLKTDELKKLYPNDDYVIGMYEQFEKVDRLDCLRKMVL
ncbi:hypothetical protein ACXR6G_20130, partial [Ancylomarina sp. YFZ004]